MFGLLVLRAGCSAWFFCLTWMFDHFSVVVFTLVDFHFAVWLLAGELFWVGRLVSVAFSCVCFGFNFTET